MTKTNINKLTNFLDKKTDFIGYTLLILTVGYAITNGFSFKPTQVAMAFKDQAVSSIQSTNPEQETEKQAKLEIANGSVTGNDVIDTPKNYSNWEAEIKSVTELKDYTFVSKKKKVFNYQHDLINKVIANKDFYKKADGCAWELMASIHIKENGAKMSEKSNDQGIFQNTKGGKDANSDPVASLKEACELLKSKVGGKDLSNINNKDLICQASWKYNGFANGQTCYNSGYNTNFLTKATAFEEQCATDGCPYKKVNLTGGVMTNIALILSK